jgi:hypothetical protein
MRTHRSPLVGGQKRSDLDYLQLSKVIPWLIRAFRASFASSGKSRERVRLHIAASLTKLTDLLEKD